MAGEKLHHAKAGVEAVEEIAEVLDSVRVFIREVVVFTTDTATKTSFVSNTALYEAYVRWCRSEGPLPHRNMRFLREFCSKTEGRVVKDRTSDKC